MRSIAILSAVAASALAAPPKLRLPTDPRPIRYQVELTVDPKADRFGGVMDLELSAQKPVETLWLNATELKIEKPPAGATVLDGGKDFVGFQWKTPLAAGKQKIHFEYSGPLATKDSSGASKQKEGDDWYVFTDFEPIDARRVFPCFDEPGYKTPWQLTLKVPAAVRAFTNTAQIKETPQGAWKTVQFGETKPLPSYLIAFAVGPIDIVEAGKSAKSGTPVRILVPRGQSERARWAAESTHQTLERLEEYFGIDYPYGKLDMVAVPLFGGAMEHPGLVTFNSSLILQKPGEETLDRKRAYAEVATHELAHQWFGDLVTTAWWDDIWLNEAFATWMTPKIIESWQPSWGAPEQRINTRSTAMGADSLVSARQIRQPINSNDDMRNAFDGITYQKGATVIATFERFIGAEKFQKGVQRYMKEHAHGNATAADFLRAVSTEAGRDITPSFSTFLDQPGVPIVSFDLVCDDQRKSGPAGGSGPGKAPHLHLSQTRYLPKGSAGGGEKQLWQIPVCVRTPEGRSCTLLSEREGNLDLKSCPAWVALNDGGYYRALPSPALVDKLEHVGLPQLTAPEKLALLSDLNALVRAGKLELSAILALAPKLAADKNRFVVQNIAGSVGWLREDELVSEKQRPAYAKFILDTFGERAKKLGWKPQAGDDEDTRILRTRLVPLVAHSGEDPALIADAQKLASAWLKDHRAIDADLVDPILGLAAEHGNRALYDQWMAAARAEKDRLERRRLLRALSQFRDPALVKESLAAVLTDSFDIREATALMWGATRDPHTQKLAWQWLQANFDALVARLPRDSGAYLPFVATSLCDEGVLPQMKAFFAPRSSKFEGGPRMLEQASEELHLCAVYRTAQAPSVEKFLAQKKTAKR
jgi:alanyl aminopeptidase